MKPHFVCYGGCKGESETQGVCQAKTCKHEGVALRACYCTDKEHVLPHEKEDESDFDLGE